MLCPRAPFHHSNSVWNTLRSSSICTYLYRPVTSLLLDVILSILSQLLPSGIIAIRCYQRSAQLQPCSWLSSQPHIFRHLLARMAREWGWLCVTGQLAFMIVIFTDVLTLGSGKYHKVAGNLFQIIYARLATYMLIIHHDKEFHWYVK